MIRRFHLIRNADPTGISGTGVVAWGVQFPDGWCVLRWTTLVASTVIFDCIEDLVAIHGHEGATHVYWLDE